MGDCLGRHPSYPVGGQFHWALIGLAPPQERRDLQGLAGPQVAKLMVALVDIMGGHAQSLTTHIALPDPFTLEQFMMDPLGSSQRLRFTFQLK